MLHCCYRALQRFMVLEGVAVVVGDAETIGVSRDSTGQVQSLDSADIERFIAEGQAPYCQSLVERLSDELLHCFGSIHDGKLISFCWFHIGGADAWMNEGYCPATGTAIRLIQNAAFVFHAYTAPEARGRRHLSQVLSAAAQELNEHFGVSHLVGTTELTNTAALAAFRRTGFDHSASYWRVGMGPWAAGWYPKPRLPVLRYGP